MNNSADFDFSFPPNGRRALAFDRKARASLADSLQHIVEQCAGAIPFDSARMASLIDGLRQGRRYPPSLCGAYFELAMALMEDRDQDAAGLFASIAEERPIDGPFRLVALGGPEIARHTTRYTTLMDSDPNTSFAMIPPAPATERDFRTRFEHGYRLLATAIPELAAEFDALVSEVCMVVGDPAAKMQFDGGSSYMLWGGLFLNASSHNSDVAMVEVIAHESAHSLLFGYALDEALVSNPDEELFSSPLRVDPRPMDGIYHATYVLARMHWAMSRLIDSGRLDAEARAAAESARALDRKSFETGYQVVRQYGRLTDTGQAVMAGARAYMDGISE
ncbi:MAG: HEXXH motif-containing putative peptide modification protein [Gallionellaceae bacterium]|nr:HEXXH motif-containing putative peptide modification protein [Gallionellaceae bacterium]